MPESPLCTPNANENAVQFTQLLERSAEGHTLFHPSLKGRLYDCAYVKGGTIVPLFNVRDGCPARNGHSAIPPYDFSMDTTSEELMRNSSVFQSAQHGTLKLGLSASFPNVSGTLELSNERRNAAFLALGGQTRLVSSIDGTRSLQTYLANNLQAIFNRFRSHHALREQDIFIVGGTTKACAWAGGVAYSGSHGANVTLGIKTAGVGLDVSLSCSSDSSCDSGLVAAPSRVELLPDPSGSGPEPMIKLSGVVCDLTCGPGAPPVGDALQSPDYCCVVKPVIALRRDKLHNKSIKVGHALKKFLGFGQDKGSDPRPKPSDGSQSSAHGSKNDAQSPADALPGGDTDCAEYYTERETRLHKLLRDILRINAHVDVVSADYAILDCHEDVLPLQYNLETWTTASGDVAAYITAPVESPDQDSRASTSATLSEVLDNVESFGRCQWELLTAAPIDRETSWRGALQTCASFLRTRRLAESHAHPGLTVLPGTSDGPLVPRGPFGDVYLGNWGDQLVAVKMFRVPKDRVQEVTHRLPREVAIWKRLGHPNLLPFITCLQRADMTLLVSPYCRNGSIIRYVAQNPAADRLPLLHDVTKALQYLHHRPSEAIVHGDIKGENILISDTGSALLADFGLSRIFVAPDKFDSPFSQIGGSLRFMAPELLRPPRAMTRASDVYAFGLLIYQIFSGDVPFPDLGDAQFIKARLTHQQPPRPATLENSALWKLATSCWEPDACRRPTARALARELQRLQRSHMSKARALPVAWTWFDRCRSKIWCMMGQSRSRPRSAPRLHVARSARHRASSQPSTDLGDTELPGRKKALLIAVNYSTPATATIPEALQPIEDACMAGGSRPVARRHRTKLLPRSHRDNQALITLLRDIYGFLDIIILQDDGDRQAPTAANIRAAIAELVADARPGDSLVFAFTGHGTQRAMDGAEADGPDEFIVGCDEQEISDHELDRILIRPIPQGCSLTAIFDCCHSRTLLDPDEHVEAVGRARNHGKRSQCTSIREWCQSTSRLKRRHLVPRAANMCFPAGRDDQVTWETSRGGTMMQMLEGLLSDEPRISILSRSSDRIHTLAPRLLRSFYRGPREWHSMVTSNAR